MQKFFLQMLAIFQKNQYFDKTTTYFSSYCRIDSETIWFFVSDTNLR